MNTDLQNDSLTVVLVPTVVDSERDDDAIFPKDILKRRRRQEFWQKLN